MATVRFVPRSRSMVFEDAAFVSVGVPSDTLTQVLLPKGRSIIRQGFSTLHSVGNSSVGTNPTTSLEEARRGVIRIGVRWRECFNRQKPGAPAVRELCGGFDQSASNTATV